LTIPLPTPNTADIQIFGQLTGKDVNASSFTCTTFYSNGALSNTYFVNSFYGSGDFSTATGTWNK
jgi:hypothetical protein